MLPVCTWHCGILDSDLSGWEKFEGLDPARWCPRGYAIASVDHRGAGNSEGSVQVMGKNMGEDGYDVIEALAKKEWCSGNVGMAGNSVSFVLPLGRAQFTDNVRRPSSTSPYLNTSSPSSSLLRSRLSLPGRDAVTSSGESHPSLRSGIFSRRLARAYGQLTPALCHS